MTSQDTQTPYVLIIEDEFAIREALTEFLEDEGFTVAGAMHGQEALDYLQSAEPPALILLDLRMPVMNGAQFLELLRDIPRMGNVPVVLMSADTSGQYEVPPDTVVEHLNKPVRLASVLDIVERYSAPSASAGC